MTRTRTAAAALLALLATAAAACGGDDSSGPTGTPPPTTGTVSGAVTAAGTGVSGARVTLDGGGAQTTPASGQYAFSSVAAGAHTLALALPPGFDLDAGQSLSRPVTVAAGQSATVNWSLRQQEQPGASTVDTVRIVGTTFQPTDLTVPAGREVVWINTSSGVFHTVTPDGHTQWSRVTTDAPGEVLRVTFGSAGQFPYYCEPHRSIGMTGTVTVQ